MKTAHTTRPNTAFTLIELSIVIVIIGLIVAGVVGGQNLVKQAKLRGIISEYNEYQVAYNSFKLEYNGVPGDFNRAADYGIGSNGNGDKKIATIHTEAVLAWKHLYNAGLINTQISNSSVPANAQNIHVDLPATSYSDDVGISMIAIGPKSWIGGWEIV